MLMIFSENRSHRVVAPPPRTNILGVPISTPCNPLSSVLPENMFTRLQNAKKCTSCGK
jgi:hypothetical protein